MNTARSQRSPLNAAAPSGITVTEIERQVEALRSNWPCDAELRELALLFAILKQGSNQTKLKRFTGYDSQFIHQMLDELRHHGKLFTGTLTAQFVLSQLPGSEDLIEQITGARPVAPVRIQPAFIPTSSKAPFRASDAPKQPSPTAFVDDLSYRLLEENVMSNASTSNGAIQPSETGSVACTRDANCTKPNKHLGKCATKATRQARPATQAKTAARVTTATEGATFQFTVFCKVDGEEYRAEGASHAKLQSALATIDRMLGGMS